MNEKLLAGVKVLDLSDAKAFFCGKILATVGADVIKIERPEGDVERSYPPFHRDEAGLERSLYWKAFNTDKRGITLDISVPQGKKLLLRLLRESDILIESFAPGHLAQLGLGYDALRTINPKLVMVSVTAFGQSGPYSQYKGSELIAVAMGGVLANTGYQERPPVKEALESTYFHGGCAGALGALLGYYHVLRGGDGQHVDVSLQEVAASRLTSAILAWQFEQINLKREGDKSQLGPTATTWFWPCKDGFLFWHMLGGLHGAPANRALTEWVDEHFADNALREVKDWRTFDKAGISQVQWDRFEAVLRPFFMLFTKEEIRRESLRRGVNATVANDADEVLHSEQLRIRDYWARIDDPVVGAMAYPRYLFKATDSDNFTERAAPGLGADNEDVYGKQLGLSRTEIEHLKDNHVI